MWLKADFTTTLNNTFPYTRRETQILSIISNICFIPRNHNLKMSIEAFIPEKSLVERHGYLFGNPIAHSMSPVLHQTVYDDLGLKWSQFPLESTDMNLFLSLIKHPQFYGMFLAKLHFVVTEKSELPQAFSPALLLTNKSFWSASVRHLCCGDKDSKYSTLAYETTRRQL